jgi:DNA modification methylase
MTTIHVGDCREVMATLEPESIDAVVCDPPYELNFMSKGWDRSGIAFDPATWAACLRVLKPGGHLLAFGGTRTVHRIAVAIEDAGFEIRDQVIWIYGSGFPKSLDVSKAIDKAAGNIRHDREVSGPAGNSVFQPTQRVINAGTPVLDDAERWQGWGTALKPAHEPVVVARKPLIGTVSRNVLAFGTGALNVDGCRIGYVNETPPDLEHCRNTSGGWKNTSTAGVVPNDNTKGRWPANVCLDEDAAAMLDAQSGRSRDTAHVRKPAGTENRVNPSGWVEVNRTTGNVTGHNDTGGASRFFYCAKASRSERNAGLDGMPGVQANFASGTGLRNNGDGTPRKMADTARNHHPTVKPVALMRWLIRLVTPPGGIVLDPFLGSGTTGIAASLEGVRFVGIEQSPEYAEIARRRIEHAAMCPAEFISADDPEPVEYDGAPVVRTQHGELQIALPMFTVAAD